MQMCRNTALCALQRPGADARRDSLFVKHMHSFFACRANDEATPKGGNELCGKNMHTYVTMLTEQAAAHRGPAQFGEVCLSQPPGS
jgi:hypothetical protein